MTFGMRLKNLRFEHGITQQELQLETGISQCTIAHWEKNHAIPSTLSLIKLSRFFQLTIDELLKGVEFNENADRRSG